MIMIQLQATPQRHHGWSRAASEEVATHNVLRILTLDHRTDGTYLVSKCALNGICPSRRTGTKDRRATQLLRNALQPFPMLWMVGVSRVIRVVLVFVVLIKDLLVVVAELLLLER